jgi:hypothetical protein
MPNTSIRYGTHTASAGLNYFIYKNTLHGFSQKDIHELEEIKNRLGVLLKPRKSRHYTAIRIKIEQNINDILREKSPKSAVKPKIASKFEKNTNETALTRKRIQVLRDEVLRMASNGMPINRIPLFRGKILDGNPVDFFRRHYAKYIKNNQEVIFSIDLSSIDKPLLTALRNTVSTENMPLGNRTAKTDAILAGKFSDGENSQASAVVAKAKRDERHGLRKVMQK